MKRSFLDALDERVLVCDGAMGTMLYARGVFINRSFDALNLAQPDLVGEVHREYLRAGADVIETQHVWRQPREARGLRPQRPAARDQRHRRARSRAARRASAAWVAGAIGPLGIRIEPFGRTGVDEAESYFKEQAAALLEGGVDLFILETFRDVNEIGAAIAAVRSLTDLPIVAQMTTEEDGNSLDGTPPEEFGPALDARGATVIGVNCSVGPAPMLETIERLARATPRTLSAQPNAGRPRDIEGRNIYLCSPEYMASYARRFIQRGVRLVGRLLRHHARAHPADPARGERAGAWRRARGRRRARLRRPLNPRPRRSRAPTSRALARVAGRRPARGHRRVGAAQGRGRHRRAGRGRAAWPALGVDAITVSEGAKGSARMSALSLAVLLKQAGLEPVLQYHCRDRYLLGMQSDLLGAHATGIRNLLLVTGDPRKRGDYSDATLVFDVDSIGLANAVTRLNRGRDVGGQAIGRPTAFHVGVVGNPTAPRLDDEVRRFEYKVEAGAEFADHPADFRPRRARRVPREDGTRARCRSWRPCGRSTACCTPSSWPTRCRTCACPRRCWPGCAVADAQGRAAEEGLAIAVEIADAVRGRVQGLQVGGPPAAVAAVLARLPVRG